MIETAEKLAIDIAGSRSEEAQHMANDFTNIEMEYGCWVQFQDLGKTVAFHCLLVLNLMHFSLLKSNYVYTCYRLNRVHAFNQQKAANQ